MSDRTAPAAHADGSTVSGAHLTLTDVTKRYAGQAKAAVDDLTLEIPAGEFVMFVGPSGCGKTTSLKMINRLIEPTAGTITIDGDDIRGHDVDELRRRIGYVIQGGSLFPHMTVAENIGLVPGLLKWDTSRTKTRVDELLDMVGLEPGRYRNRYPRELSGGQQQRVGVARGLAADPPVILMDEPFGAVDPVTRQRLQDEMLSIQRELHKTIVCVTHDIDEAIKLGDRILILSEGAHIEQYDTPENVLAAPANRFVEDFVGAGSGLKQLSLARVDDLRLEQRTTARLDEPVADVAARARAEGYTSCIVLDERNRPIGFVWLNRLVGDRVTRPERVGVYSVDHRSTVSDALDSMLASTYNAVVVTGDRGEYRGVVTFAAVTEYVQRLSREAEEQR